MCVDNRRKQLFHPFNHACGPLRVGEGLGKRQTSARGLGDFSLRARRCAPAALGKTVRECDIHKLSVENEYVYTPHHLRISLGRLEVACVRTPVCTQCKHTQPFQAELL